MACTRRILTLSQIWSVVTLTGRTQLIAETEGLFCYDSTKKCNRDHWFYYTLVRWFFLRRAGAFIEGDELDEHYKFRTRER